MIWAYLLLHLCKCIWLGHSLLYFAPLRIHSYPDDREALPGSVVGSLLYRLWASRPIKRSYAKLKGNRCRRLNAFMFWVESNSYPAMLPAWAVSKALRLLWAACLNQHLSISCKFLLRHAECWSWSAWKAPHLLCAESLLWSASRENLPEVLSFY